MTPKKVAISLQKNVRSEWSGAAKDKHTIVQIKPPYIIENIFADQSTKDEELGTDHRHGMVVTTTRSGTIDYDASPLP